MSVKNVIIMVGVQGSGKTSFINSSNLPNQFVLSFDKKISEMFNPNNYDDAYRQWRESSIFFKMITSKEIYMLLKSALDSDGVENIFIDFTNLTIEDRKNWIDKVKDKATKIVAIYIEKDIKELLKVERPNKTIPESLLRENLQKLQIPTFSEGFDEIYHY